jgi:hypothetical protein
MKHFFTKEVSRLLTHRVLYCTSSINHDAAHVNPMAERRNYGRKSASFFMPLQKVTPSYIQCK